MFVLGTYPTRLLHHDLFTVTPWSGVTECLDPSTIWPTGQESWRFLFLRQQGVVISTYYTYWYTSDTSILFYLTRNTCKFLQYFLKLFFSNTRYFLNPETVQLMFTYVYNILHIIHIKTYVKSFFTILEPNIHAPPPPSTNPTLISNWLVRILFILESFCTDRNFFLDMYYLIKKYLMADLHTNLKKKQPNKQM